MDTRIFFHLVDSIETADSAAELEVSIDLVRASVMSPPERGALERLLHARARSLRTGDAPVLRPPATVRDKLARQPSTDWCKP